MSYHSGSYSADDDRTFANQQYAVIGQKDGYTHHEYIQLSSPPPAHRNPRSTIDPDSTQIPPPPMHHFCIGQEEELAQDNEAQSSPWRPGIFHSMPWLGLGALLAGLASAIAAIVVLYSANGKAVTEWPTPQHPVQLTVVLAILSALGSAALGAAHMEGVTIAWWTKMLCGGDLRDSHRFWEHGSSAWKSATQLQHMSKVSLSSLLLVLMLASGPLLQRAATIKPVRLSAVASLQAAVPTNTLRGPTGLYLSHARVASVLTTRFGQAVQNFTAHSDIKLDVHGCQGSCTGVIVAPGFDVSCSQAMVPYNLTMGTPLPNDTSIGHIQFRYDTAGKPGVLNISTMYKPQKDAIGNYIANSCTLRFAQVRCPVQISNGTVSLMPVDYSATNNTVALEYPPLEFSGLGPIPSALGGLFLVIGDLFTSDVKVRFTSTLEFIGSGPMQYTYMTSNDSALGYPSMTWIDPMPFVIDALREIAFRTAVAVANSSDTQYFQGREEFLVSKYVLRDGFLVCATTLVLLAALAIASLFYQYWLLGRHVSMSPLEIVAAFKAPLTAGAGANSDVDRLLREIGDRKVQYGIVNMTMPTLAMVSLPGHVSQPVKGRQYI
ncbi:hypothetical protein PWT90_07963 [Aphanocladium album]|nr:hypothetical protein PWT90_07963 [Aphanocladium album]